MSPGFSLLWDPGNDLLGSPHFRATAIGSKSGYESTCPFVSCALAPLLPRFHRRALPLNGRCCTPLPALWRPEQIRFHLTADGCRLTAFGGFAPYRLCNFSKPDGIPCGSPTLRGKKLCYYHLRDARRRERSAAAIRKADVLGPVLPPMNSHYDIRDALTEVLNVLWQSRISDRRAGRILFDIQQATKAVVRTEAS